MNVTGTTNYRMYACDATSDLPRSLGIGSNDAVADPSCDL